MNAIKQVGASGQITLGKKYAGKTFQMIEEEKEGKIILVLGSFIPKNEIWLHQEPQKTRLDRAIRWAEKNQPRESNLKDLK